MRLLTRSDFDGLASAVLLVEKGVVDEFQFVHPKDIQDGKVEVGPNDVLANIPYVAGCGMWFDHHASEEHRLDIDSLTFEGDCRAAQSAAQVIWDYYDGEKSFGNHLKPLLEAVNKSDSGNLTREEILYPQGWILVSFIMDPRTGLGRFSDYRISNYQLMLDLIQYCRSKTVDEILEIEDVKERVARYREHEKPHREMLKRCCNVYGNVIVTNLLHEETLYCGNRFVVFALYPDQNIEARVMWGRKQQNVVITCGHSILNRSSMTNVGQLMLKYGGGGHDKVGTCQVETSDWERVLNEIVEQMQKDG
jgi:nanoRNase/pAp phosphatase (c-di-AMP/oligoRNAs hydrolase)